MTARLATCDLAIGHGRVPLARSINLELQPAEVIALVGPSGCGKSTLLSTIAGILPALSGSISIDGEDVTDAAIHTRRVGMVFQDPLLFPHLSVADNIAYGLRRHGVARSQARVQARELLEWVDLAGLGNRRPDQLSGGQSQRVGLARALAPEPRVLLLDEPFSALDSSLRHRLAGEVADLLRERHVAAIHVTHDLDEAAAVADHVYSFDEITSPCDP